MTPHIDLVGHKFGRLTVISFAYILKNNRWWHCLCKCGNKKTLTTAVLKGGHSRSCGCLARDFAKARATKHGKHGIPEYEIWKSMKQRCHNENAKDYHFYGARGISVCEKWRDSFDAFIEDIGYRPGKDYSIERINVNGNYAPGNVKWIRRFMQHRNTRRNVMIEWNGKTMCLLDWSEETGIPHSTLRNRVYVYNMKPPELFAPKGAYWGGKIIHLRTKSWKSKK